MCSLIWPLLGKDEKSKKTAGPKLPIKAGSQPVSLALNAVSGNEDQEFCQFGYLDTRFKPLTHIYLASSNHHTPNTADSH